MSNFAEAIKRKPRPQRICQCTAAVIEIAPCIVHKSAYRLLSCLINAEAMLTKYEVEHHYKTSELVKDIRAVIRRAGGQHG